MCPRGIAIAITALPCGWIALLAMALTRVACARASAKGGQLHISRGFGVHYLPLYVMEAKALLQKRALAAGLDGVKVEFLLIDGGNHINDTVLARSVDIASTGTGGFRSLWQPSWQPCRMPLSSLRQTGRRRHRSILRPPRRSSPRPKSCASSMIPTCALCWSLPAS